MHSIAYRSAMSSLIAAVLVVGAPTSVRAQQERTAAEEQEVVSLATIVGAALQGQIVPTEEPFGWAHDFLKSSEQTTFVPFTLSVDQSKLGTASAAMYIFVAPQGASAASGTDATASAPPEPAFEDAYHVDLGAPTTDGVYEISRGFWVPGGDYDVYVALSESGVPDGTEPKTMMLKKPLSVPNLWSDELATSTVILAERVEPLTAPLPPDQLLANPYTLGTMRIVPKTTPEYLTSGEFSMVLLVYNVGLTASGLPDVNVEYAINTRLAAGEEFFNRTSPQAFNEQTLPQGFDVSAGHQLVAGQAISLSSFPAAEYRLEITVTDNTSGVTLTRSVDFSVAES